MARGAIGFGIGLIVLGLWAYLGTGTSSVTALIPAFFGLPIALLGVAALRDTLRKHAMHGAAALALLGALGSLRSLPDVFAMLGGSAVDRPAATVVQGLMFLGCVVFVGFAVRSFVMARRERQQQPAA